MLSSSARPLVVWLVDQVKNYVQRWAGLGPSPSDDLFHMIEIGVEAVSTEVGRLKPPAIMNAKEIGMNVVLTKAAIQQGQVIVPAPINLPDGTEVVVSASSAIFEDEVDKDWDNSPEGISEWLKWYDSLEPLIFTPEEQLDTEAWLK